MKRREDAALGAALIMTMLAAVLPSVVADARRGAARPAAPSADALGLAYQAAERGYRELVLEPDAWRQVQLGRPPAGFDLDSAFPAAGGALYAVRLSSGPLPGQVTITGVARAGGGQTRAVRAVYDYFPNSSVREVACRWDSGAPRCP
jgi:hypothetical protein